MIRKYDEHTCVERTERARRYTEETIARVEAYKRDAACLPEPDNVRPEAVHGPGAERVRRLNQRECLYCWHIRGSMLAGQAFTEWTCQCCGSEHMHHCTAVPMLCNDCADKFWACVCCGAQRNLVLPPEVEKELARQKQGRSARGKKRRK